MKKTKLKKTVKIVAKKMVKNPGKKALAKKLSEKLPQKKGAKEKTVMKEVEIETHALPIKPAKKSGHPHDIEKILDELEEERGSMDEY